MNSIVGITFVGAAIIAVISIAVSFVVTCFIAFAMVKKSSNRKVDPFFTDESFMNCREMMGDKVEALD